MFVDNKQKRERKLLDLGMKGIHLHMKSGSLLADCKSSRVNLSTLESTNDDFFFQGVQSIIAWARAQTSSNLSQFIIQLEICILINSTQTTFTSAKIYEKNNNLKANCR